MANKEEEILKAAEEEFMLRGFDGAKTTAIAKRAGVTHAMLHYYYRTKQDLFDKVVRDKIGMMSTLVTTAFDNDGSPFVERVTRVIKSHFDFFIDNPMLPRFVINELVTSAERIEMLKSLVGELAKKLVFGLQKEIDECVERGEMKPIKAIDLLIDVVSINVFNFIAFPVLEFVSKEYYSTRNEFLEARRRESVKTILSRILVDTSNI